MKINEMYNSKKPVVSFEVFPPKKEADVQGIYDTLEQLGNLHPDFMSVTYSAGGSGGSQITLDIASLIKEKYGTECLPHLTCINSTADEVQKIVEEIRMRGIENIMALRGDLIGDSTGAGEFKYAKELISNIRKDCPDMCIGAAAYAEGHVDCESLDLSVEYLKQKVDAGANFLVTQLFFDNRSFYEFYEKAIKSGIKIPISAGIMPILSKSQIQKMIFMCGVSLPSEIVKILYKYENNIDDLKKAAMDYSANQINDLISHGVDGVHIYTMNRPEIARENVLRMKNYNGANI
ncbi:MAG: methylenetetrahydrofolate reductase [NAD(P)H] [Oscillospiraceae bacterium]|nr:methylenetetrahydrofolate reductase [NAD(P)H] [Oscillospiraceae bacterium]